MTRLPKAAPATGERPPGFLTWADNRLNPILVRDLRRWLRSKKFLMLFFLALAVAEVVTLALTYSAAELPEAGRILFGVLAGGLGFFVACAIPFVVHLELADELNKRTSDLVLISAMTPGQFVRGKVLSGAVASLLVFSAVGPSFFLAYLLGGVDLRAVAYMVVMLLISAFNFSLLAVLLAVILGRRRHLPVAGLLLLGAGFSMAGFFAGIVFEGAERVMVDKDFWLANGIGLLTTLLWMFFFYTLSVSRMSFKADNRDLWPRIALLTVVVATTGGFVGMVWIIEGVVGMGLVSWSEVILIAAHMALSSFLFWVLFIMDTPEHPSPRVKKAWPRLMPVAQLFYPGPGRLYSFILTVFLLLGVTVWMACDKRGAYAFVVLLWISTAALGAGTLVHGLFLRWGRSVSRGLIVFATFVGWNLLGLALSIIQMSTPNAPEWLHAFNPVGALTYLYSSSWSRITDRAGHIFIIMAPMVLLTLVYWGAQIIDSLREDHVLRRERKEENLCRGSAAAAGNISASSNPDTINTGIQGEAGDASNAD